MLKNVNENSPQKSENLSIKSDSPSIQRPEDAKLNNSFNIKLSQDLACSKTMLSDRGPRQTQHEGNNKTIYQQKIPNIVTQSQESLKCSTLSQKETSLKNSDIIKSNMSKKESSLLATLKKVDSRMTIDIFKATQKVN